MNFKLKELQQQPFAVVETFDPAPPRLGDIINFNDKYYKVLQVIHFAKEVTVDEKGNIKYSGEAHVDPMKWNVPEVTVTQIPVI